MNLTWPSWQDDADISLQSRDADSARNLLCDSKEGDEEQQQGCNGGNGWKYDSRNRLQRRPRSSTHGAVNHGVAMKKSISWLWHMLTHACLLLLGLFAIWKFLVPQPTNLQETSLTLDGKSFPSGQLSWSQKFTPLPCGNTPEVAKAKGCHFDLIATAWLPPECIDYELVAEFQSFNTWKFFKDPNGTQLLSDDPDTLGSTEGTIHTSSLWHSAHCLFMWKKLNRALLLGKMTDGETIKQGHTDHCSKDILRIAGRNPHALTAIMEIIYPPC